MSESAAYPQAGEVEPTCPRHPGTVAYVRCQRCMRPTCPACQRPAAVGVQCVDCVREGAASMRTSRTIFGGTARSDTRPLMTQGIIGLCVAVFVLQWASPAVTSKMVFAPGIGPTEPWRFLTNAFAHQPGSIMHIGFNMFALWAFGQYLEPLLGRARFLAVYLISAVGGSVGVVLLADPSSRSWWTGVVGASGAVFGLFGAYFVLQRSLGRDAAGMYVLIGLNAVIGFVVPGIAWQAHLGGLVTGALCAAVIAYAGRSRSAAGPPRVSVQWAGLGGVLLLVVAVVVVKYLSA